MLSSSTSTDLLLIQLLQLQLQVRVVWLNISMAAENSVPPATEEIRLLLIGAPKTGQSSIANILAGTNVFSVGASSSVNTAVPTTQSRHYTNKKILVGKHLLVVDAPVSDSNFSQGLKGTRVSLLASICTQRCHI